LGLLLIKDLGRDAAGEANVSLATVGAKLSDLVPAGAERFARSFAYSDASPKVLVLSGGYPQPGWGVLVEWRNARQFEDLISRTTAQLRTADSANRLQLFTEAAENFLRLQGLRKRPARPPIIIELVAEIAAAEKVESLIGEARAGLQADNYDLVSDKITAAVQRMQQAELNVPDSLLKPLSDVQKDLRIAGNLLAVSTEVFANEIEPKLTSLLERPYSAGSHLPELIGKKIKAGTQVMP
jgi:hypothetical protein